MDREVTVRRDVSSPMRDGVQLKADVYTPEGPGPFPVVLLRTPYGKTGGQSPGYRHPLWYARQGFVVVVQDVRGRGASDGDWYPFEHEAEDGYDSVEWAAALPKSNGRVGMYGFSYPGACQLLAATLQPPHLACIVPALTASDYWNGWTYRGGALQQAFVQSWVLDELGSDTARRRGLSDLGRQMRAALRDINGVFDELPLDQGSMAAARGIADYYFDWLHHPTPDSYWHRWNLEQRFAQISVPALHIAAWYDIFLEGTLRNFTGIRDAAESRVARAQQLVIGPWTHMFWSRFVEGRDFGPEARNDVDELQLRWFERWLRDEAISDHHEPPVRAFVMGANEWRTDDAWPPAESREEELYLASNGAANSLNGDGTLTTAASSTSPYDVFVYDPLHPVRSAGGRSCCTAELVPMGPANQVEVESRNSVLVYTSAPLLSDATVLGPVSLVLHAATTAVDTDFAAKLVDVHHEGLAINVADGILRTRYRDSWSDPALVEPGRCYEYRVDMGATGVVFKAGHRIRLEVASSNFPAYDRNLNTGGPIGSEPREAAKVATQLVFHDASRPSRLKLSVIGALTFEG